MRIEWVERRTCYSKLRPITSYIQSHCSTINQSRQRLHLCQWKEDHDWVNRDKWSCVILVESICTSSRCRPYYVDYQELHVLALWFDRKRFKVEPIKCTQLQIKVNLQRRCYFVVSLPQSHITKQLVFIQFSLFLVKLLTKTTSCLWLTAPWRKSSKFQSRWTPSTVTRG